MKLSCSFRLKIRLLYRKSQHTFYVQYRVSENLALYEAMWQNMVVPGRTQNTVHALCMLNK